MTTWTTEQMGGFINHMAKSVEETANMLEERHGEYPPAPMTLEYFAGYLHGLRTTAKGLKWSAALAAAADQLGPEAFDELAERLDDIAERSG